MNRWLFAILAFAASTAGIACPLCLGAYKTPLADHLVEARSVVLADPAADGRSFRVAAVIKGAALRGSVIDASSVAPAPASDATLRPVGASSATQNRAGAVLLVKDRDWSSWEVLGEIRTEHAGWLRRIAGGSRVADMTMAEWRTRVALMLPYLEHREPLVAQFAYSELASAPYESLLASKPLLAAPTIRRWLADPELAAREPLYVLLIGIAGDSRDAAAIERKLESEDGPRIAPLIAADLELRGPSRLAWVQERYLGDRKRSSADIEAVLTALSVQGTANRTIPRERVIAVYRTFMTAHPDIAGYVARDLAAWQYWDAVPEYAALMKSGVRQQYPSQLAIVGYLRQAGVAQP